MYALVMNIHDVMVPDTNVGSEDLPKLTYVQGSENIIAHQLPTNCVNAIAVISQLVATRVVDSHCGCGLGVWLSLPQ